MKRAWLLLAAMLVGVAAWSAEDGGCHLQLRSRVELFRGTNQWREAHVDYPFDPSKSALIVCDMWDKH